MTKRDFWYFLGGIILAILSIDWFVIPFILIPLFDSILTICIFAIILANIELIMWYKFWRWFFTSWLARRKSIKETIEFTKGITNEAKEDKKVKGYLDRIIDHFESTFTWATNPDSRLWKFIKVWGHLGMFFLGWEPFFWGGRLTGVIFCSTTGWKNGIYSLCFGNIFHVIISVLSWKIGFQFWDYIWGRIL